MSLIKDHIRTITVDSYSTLLDVDSAAKALQGKVERPESLAQLWRARSLTYAMLSNFLDSYEPFYELNRKALAYALKVHGLELDQAEREDILSVYHRLDAFPDVREGLVRIRELGYPVYVLSNGDPDMLSSLVKGARIEDVISGVISADEIRTYKPASELYHYASERTDTLSGAIAHVSAAWFDVAGAQHAGMQGIWMNRKQTPDETFGPKPDLVVKDFNELADYLSGQ